MKSQTASLSDEAVIATIADDGAIDPHVSGPEVATDTMALPEKLMPGTAAATTMPSTPAPESKPQASPANGKASVPYFFMTTAQKRQVQRKRKEQEVLEEENVRKRRQNAAEIPRSIITNQDRERFRVIFNKGWTRAGGHECVDACYPNSEDHSHGHVPAPEYNKLQQSNDAETLCGLTIAPLITDKSEDPQSGLQVANDGYKESKFSFENFNQCKDGQRPPQSTLISHSPEPPTDLALQSPDGGRSDGRVRRQKYSVTKGSLINLWGDHVTMFRRLTDRIIEKLSTNSLLSSRDGDCRSRVLLMKDYYQPRRVDEMISGQREFGELAEWIEPMKVSLSANVNKQATTVDEDPRDNRGPEHDRRLPETVQDQEAALDCPHTTDSEGSKDKYKLHTDDDPSDDDFASPRRPLPPKSRNRRREAIAPADGVEHAAQKHGRRKRPGNGGRKQSRLERELAELIGPTSKDAATAGGRYKKSKKRGSGSMNMDLYAANFGIIDGYELAVSLPPKYPKVALVMGPAGSGKTAGIYACARQCGYRVHEVHPGNKRSGQDLVAELSELVQTYIVPTTTATLAGDGNSVEKTGDGGASREMLILLEHVDVLFETDQGFWPALATLARKSRRPIIATCNSESVEHLSLWDSDIGEGGGGGAGLPPPPLFERVWRVDPAPVDVAAAYLFLVCLDRGFVVVVPGQLRELYLWAGCDIRRAINQLELWLCLPTALEAPNNILDDDDGGKDKCVIELDHIIGRIGLDRSGGGMAGLSSSQDREGAGERLEFTAMRLDLGHQLQSLNTAMPNGVEPNSGCYQSQQDLDALANRLDSISLAHIYQSGLQLAIEDEREPTVFSANPFDGSIPDQLQGVSYLAVNPGRIANYPVDYGVPLLASTIAEDLYRRSILMGEILTQSSSSGRGGSDKLDAGAAREVAIRLGERHRSCAEALDRYNVPWEVHPLADTCEYLGHMSIMSQWIRIHTNDPDIMPPGLCQPELADPSLVPPKSSVGSARRTRSSSYRPHLNLHRHLIEYLSTFFSTTGNVVHN